MFIKSSEFNEKNIKELVDVNDFDWIKSEIILWNHYLDDYNMQQNSAIKIFS